MQPEPPYKRRLWLSAPANKKTASALAPPKKWRLRLRNTEKNYNLFADYLTIGMDLGEDGRTVDHLKIV